MTAVSYRGTPSQNLNIPQSQNTAPVLEFRCLFTHDILKKQKKWHDGSLRFHTFNRRVMVYDESKNLVGDLHYRQAEEFSEGLEFQLDKPVKVVVEEQLGQSRTDLTPLLGRQNQDGTVQQDKARSAKIHAARSNVSSLQGKPKSIKELLGASQGHLGRAMLPQRSPFEQRQSLLETNQEPPSKRQKIRSNKENITPGPAPQPLSTHLHAPRSKDIASPNAHRGSNTHSNEIIDLSSSDTEHVSRPPADPICVNNRNKVSAAKRALQDPNAVGAILGLSLGKSEQENSAKKRKRTGKKKINSDSLLQNPGLSMSKMISPAQDTSKSSRPAASGARTSLSFAKQNPRRKLTYKALLPNHVLSESTGRAVRSAQAVVVSPLSQRNTEGPRSDGFKKNTTTDLDEFLDDLDEQELLSTQHQPPRMSSPDLAHTNVLTPGQMTVGSDVRLRNLQSFEAEESCSRIDSSPLFMPRTISQVSQASVQRVDNDDFCVPSQSRTSITVPPTQRPVSDSDIIPVIEDSFSRRVLASEHSDGEEQDLSEPPSTRNLAQQSGQKGEVGVKEAEYPQQNSVSGHDEAPDFSAAVPIQNSQSTDTVRLNRSAQRYDTLRRVQSENNAETSSDLINPDENVLNRDTVNQGSHPSQPRLSPTKLLQRTNSDTAAIISRVIQGHPRAVIETRLDTAEDLEGLSTDSAPDEEVGPWTRTEAFLLFDRWPESKRKNKPDFGQIEVNSSRHQPAQNQSKLSGIETRKYALFASARFVSQG